MSKRKRQAPPKRRNAVVQAMKLRSAKAGHHTDRKKEASRRACRQKYRT